MIGRAVAQPWALPPLPGESEAALRERRDQAYFDQQREDSREWWRRMGGETPLAGLRVLDFGCGHGALAVAAAERGAAHVVGLDLDEARIAFARRKVRDDFPDLAGRVRFEARDIADLDDDPNDDLDPDHDEELVDDHREGLDLDEPESDDTDEAAEAIDVPTETRKLDALLARRQVLDQRIAQLSAVCPMR